MLRDITRECFAKPGTEEAAQVARRIFPSLQPGPHLAVRLTDWLLHPVDPLLDDLGDGLAALCLVGLLVPEGFGESLGTQTLEAVDPAAGVLDGESFGIVDAEPTGALLAGLSLSELEGEGRHARLGDADIETRAFAVVEL